MKIEVDTKAITKTKKTEPVKLMDFQDIRDSELRDAFKVEHKKFAGRRVLVIDDLYRSGATLHYITEALQNQGCASQVLVLALTKTRVKR